MSNPIRYDPALVRTLATELHHRLAGRRCAGLPVFLAGRAVLLPLEGGEALRLDLHPTRGWVRLVQTPREHHDPGELAAVVAEVRAPCDERRLVLVLETAARFAAERRELVVELHGNQWNALTVDADSGAILSVLWARAAGGRRLFAGEPYVPPAHAVRFGAGATERADAWARWCERLEGLPPAERAQRLVEEFAFVGTLSARLLAGHPALTAEPVPPELAFEAWWRLRAGQQAGAVLLRLRTGAHPYPMRLPGVAADPMPSLLAAMEEAAGALPAETAPARVADEVMLAVERAQRSAQRRAERLRAQLLRGPSVPELRQRGDLLLAQLHRVPRGAPSVRLQNWEGGEVVIELDPALGPAENAARWYDRARRRERAEARIPALAAEAEAEAERWASVLAACQRGEPLPGWAQARLAQSPAKQQSAASAPGLPFRRYRTSGGLEVRVGRSARDNDRLTFHHAAPHDVWLHARSVPGSHVILRWSDPEGAPPARDLGEAAALAALYSRARTSALVAVDWTRRKHVRKPRGAPPGSVIPQRVKTVFVEPDPEIEARLRVDPLS